MRRFHLIAAMGALTLGNAWWSTRSGPTVLLHATDLRVGDRVEALAASDKRCAVVVAFRSDCPFCARAADRERSRSATLPTTWLAPSDDHGAAGYAEQVHPDSRVTISDAAFASMKVEAVPAAVLVDSDGWIKRAWPYRGDEDVPALIKACTMPTSPPDTVDARGA